MANRKSIDGNRLKGSSMMYPYIEFDDGLVVVHSDVVTEDGVDKVFVHFERPNHDGFDSARCVLPAYEWIIWEGSFSPEERTRFNRFLKDNAALIYRYASRGGLQVA